MKELHGVWKIKNTAEMVKVAEMKLEDIPEVYSLGHQLFHSRELATLYRTWDAHEVTTNFNQNPELCLIAWLGNEKIVGFALGTT